MKKTLLLLFSFITVGAVAQSTDESAIKQIFDKELVDGKSYPWLEYLTTRVGSRLTGSPGAAAGVEWSRHELENVADSVWLQPVMVPHWLRGQQEVGRILNTKKSGPIDVNVCALGNSVGTGPGGVTGVILEVKNFDDLKKLGEKNIKGKIIFFNRPMDPTKVDAFEAYGGAVDQRAFGASEAAKFGAVGVVVRSMGLNQEDYPHTGALRYTPNVPKIPAIAISTKHAERLSKLIKEEKEVQFYFETHCEMLPDAPSFNVIGEIKGYEYPDEIIVVGGHLDSWDLAQGAHDDGAGCVQAMEVLRLFKIMGIKPKRTIRAVMFMNEENGLRGGLEYAKQAELKKEKHIAAIESDRGGFAPRGFSMSATEAVKTKVKSWKPLLEPYGLTDFNQESGGADIGPLAPQGVAVFEYLPDSQRYFDYHHTPEDTIDKVSKRELELGAASMTALVYLIDKYGF
ncbi:M20/M25/M40 family metallo-hydrolase [Chryseolinea lacunae]|uniref:Carboxypeptidase Q n=1 Tax=Chryseolinea lacunae TaxID=2801331 RepID=A0ABS1KVC3_9BACT|nr:M28 family peptidase [Chryseolinea lacunae]MBL0743314.1 M20/M25/M40 family metallo-hydrolase [Chryseolinea lacunae]